MDKYGQSVETPTTNEESLKKRSRRNKTTPPSMNATFIKETGSTPVRPNPRPLWVHSPEDRKTQITQIVEETTQYIKDDILTMNQNLQSLNAQMTTCLRNCQDIKQEIRSSNYKTQFSKMKTQI